MSLHTWTAIIAVVLAGLSAGNFIGGRLADRYSVLACQAWVAAACAAASLTSIATLFLVKIMYVVITSVSDHLFGNPLYVQRSWAILIMTTMIFFVPSLFSGIILPVLTKIAVEKTPAHRGGVIGTLYAVATAGSIAGALLAGYVLIAFMGSMGAVITVSVIYAVIAFVFKPRLSMLALAPVIVAFALVVGGAGDKLLAAIAPPCLEESNYSCISVFETDISTTNEAPRMVRMLKMEATIHSLSDRDDPTRLHMDYIRGADAIPALHHGDGPMDSFFLGGGGFTLPRAYVNGRPGSRIVVAEIDRDMERVAREHM